MRRTRPGVCAVEHTLTWANSAATSPLRPLSGKRFDFRATVYRYFTVPRTILDGLLAATSKGAYFNRHIRDGFPYRRLVDPTH